MCIPTPPNIILKQTTLNLQVKLNIHNLHRLKAKLMSNNKSHTYIYMYIYFYLKIRQAYVQFKYRQNNIQQ